MPNAEKEVLLDVLQDDPSMYYSPHVFMCCIFCYDWTLATTFCSSPCHVSLSVFTICFVYMNWRCGPLPPLDSLPRPVLCTWIGGAAPCPLDCLPRPVHHCRDVRSENGTRECDVGFVITGGARSRMFVLINFCVDQACTVYILPTYPLHRRTNHRPT